MHQDDFFRLCDVSKIPLGSASSASLACTSLFLCGKPVMDTASSATISTDGVWIEPGFSISSKTLPKAADGGAGGTAGASGGNGANGLSAPNINLSANKLMMTSGDSVEYLSKGQDGGNGGNGIQGQNNMVGWVN